MELTDWIRTGSLIVVFMVCALWSERRVWNTINILAGVGFGLGFTLVPNLMLDFQVEETNSLDATHLFLGRVFGLSLACNTFVCYFTRDSRDGTVPITIIMSKVFGSSFVLMSQLYSYLGTAHGRKYWNEQFVWFGMFGTALWFLGNLVHLRRSHDFSTYPQHNIQLNNHLRIDSWSMFIISLLMLALPEFFIRHMFNKAGNVIHLHLIRCAGSIGLGDAIVSLQAPGFLHERDKRAQLLARILWIFCLCVPWLVGCLLMEVISLNALSHLMLLYLLPLVNALIGYFTEANTIYTVPKSD